jgi:flagellar basal-body rod protein FlgB
LQLWLAQRRELDRRTHGGCVSTINNDASLIEALRRQMTIAAARELAASSNLSNVDTPGYKTRDVKFDATLDRQLQTAPPTTTDPRHMGDRTNVSSANATAEVTDLPERRDGNNVQVDRELLSMTRAAADFSAAQTVLAAKFRLVRYAINEGK